MKPIVPVLGIASALWLFLGTWWMSSMVCTPNNTTTFEVNDGKFNATSTEMFTFLLSSDKMQYTQNTGTAFKKVAKHLADNPNKQLILTGLYGENEKNGSSYENLGVARAETVKDFLNRNGAYGDNIKTTSLQSDNLSFELIDGKRLMTGGVNFLFQGESSESSSGQIEETNNSTSDVPKEKSSDISFSSDQPMFLNITEANNDFSKTESFKNYFSELKSYLKDNSAKKLILTCYNDDSALAKVITRKVKLVLGKMGLSDTTITRKTGKASDSPNGIAGVNIEIK